MQPSNFGRTGVRRHDGRHNEYRRLERRDGGNKKGKKKKKRTGENLWVAVSFKQKTLQPIRKKEWRYVNSCSSYMCPTMTMTSYEYDIVRADIKQHKI